MWAPSLAETTGRLAGLSLALALTAACGDSRGGASRVNPTYVEVAPEEFLGDFDCATSSGGLRLYVATLIDVTKDSQGRPVNFRLPSSPPTSCRDSVFFSGVVPAGRALGEVRQAHEYTAEIEGYDASSLRPTHEGSSVMQTGGRTVSPGWIGSCGTDQSSLAPLLGVDAGAADAGATEFLRHFEGPVTPALGRTVTFRGCSLWAVSESTEGASVSVDLEQALGPLECGDEPGRVATFEVTLDGVAKGAACGNEVVFSDLPPGAFLEFDVVAFEGAGDSGATGPNWTTTCYQEPRLGLRLSARCDPLVRSR